MGGNAIKSSIRLTADNYAKVVSDVKKALNGIPFEVIPAYFQKPDFGDMDLLFPAEATYTPVILKLLRATEVVKNGTVTSIGFPTDYGVFQIDLIHVPLQFYEFALNYFSWNDCGNLIGRCAHRLGFKFGHLGLRYVLREPNNSSHVLQELLITNSYKDALKFCGYNYEDYLKGVNGGFQTLEDIFKFVMSSPHFNKEIYLLDNRNAISRVRDSKRKTYMSFLKYLENLTTPTVEVDKAVLREQHLALALETFKEFEYSYTKALKDQQDKNIFKEKFNGSIVREITGLHSEYLGSFIVAYKKTFESEQDFNTFIIESPQEVINSSIEEYYNSVPD